MQSLQFEQAKQRKEQDRINAYNKLKELGSTQNEIDSLFESNQR